MNATNKTRILDLLRESKLRAESGHPNKALRLIQEAIDLMG